jgi:hypothetical protein
MLHDAIFTATCNAVLGDSLYGAGRESIEMARVQRKWRESNENGAGNKFRGASKKFQGAGNKINCPILIFKMAAILTKSSAIIRSNIVSFCGNSASFKLN